MIKLAYRDHATYEHMKKFSDNKTYINNKEQMPMHLQS